MRPTVRIIVFLSLLGAALLIPRLGQSHLWDPWEPKYAQTAREMRERGDWVVPYYRHDPRLVKPPLTYWLIATSQSAFGENEFAARLPSAALALATALALALALSRRGLPFAGFLAGAALLTSPQWVLLGRFATPDMPLAACGGMLLAVAIAWPACVGRTRWVLSFAVVVLLGTGALIEWPRGWLLPAWCVLGWGAWLDRWRGVGLFAIVAVVYAVGQFSYNPWLNLAACALAGIGALATLKVSARLGFRGMLLAGSAVTALAAPWFVAVYRAHPDETVHRLFGYKHAINLGEALGRHIAPPWYPLLIVGVGALPWVGAAASALVAQFTRSSAASVSDTRLHLEVGRVAAGTCLGLLAFYSLSEAHMGHFYGVLQPSIAVLAGLGLASLGEAGGVRLAAAAVALYVGGAFVAFDASLLLEGANVFSNLEGHDPWTAIAGAGVLWLVCVTLGWVRKRPGWFVLAVAAPAVVVGAFVIGTVPSLDVAKSQGAMWKRYVAEARPGEPLGTWGQAKDSIFYYSNNAVPRIRDPSDLHAFLDGDGGRYLIAPHDDIDRLRQATPPLGRWELLDERHPQHALLRYRRPVIRTEVRPSAESSTPAKPGHSPP